MRSNDILNREEIREKLQKAIKDGNTGEFYENLDLMMECIGQEVRAEYEASVGELQQKMDTQALAARGVRQLTAKETEYYQKLAEAMRAKDPKQALANMDVVMPETVIDAVFSDLRTSHPLLSRITFMSTNAAVKVIMNTNGHQEAVWGPLCGEIIKELASGFKEVDTGLLKLTAFLPVCKAMLDLGPVWIDNYVRQILTEAVANGLESGCVSGDGKDKPIGMNRQVGDGVSVSGGVYPEKEKIVVTDFSASTVGNLLSMMAMDENGKHRAVSDLILLVSPQDYFQKILPATTMMAPDGTYRNNVLPYPIDIIQTAALDNGEAILGIASRYFAAAGSPTGGNIEFSDHYRFLEDERVYLIRAYANGMPMDNNAFLHLDISGLQPLTWKVQQVDGPAAPTDATLSSLQIGNLTLTPAFAAATTTYTAATTNATNVVRAVPNHAGAIVEIINKDTDGSDRAEIANGAAATWYDGSNTLTVTVTAADGETTKTYTVTVTKS